MEKWRAKSRYSITPKNSSYSFGFQSQMHVAQAVMSHSFATLEYHLKHLYLT